MNPFHRTQKLELVNLRKVSAGQQSSSSSRLKDLVADNQKMYFALQTFLLAGADRQISQLGEVNTLLSRGDAAKAGGNNQTARADYETAAKIEIYKQNKERARSCLVLAEGVPEKEQSHHEFRETMLADMDEVLRISKAYHSSLPN